MGKRGKVEGGRERGDGGCERNRDRECAREKERERERLRVGKKGKG